MADSKEILDKFYSGLEEVRLSAPDDELRWTGEQLALAGERLAAEKNGGRTPRAAELLVIAYPHVEALAHAGMVDEAVRTLVMALLTVLHARVSPEEFPSLYLQMLQALCIKSTELLQATADGMEQQRLAAKVTAPALGLFAATARDFGPRFGLPHQMEVFASRARHAVEGAGEEASHFCGMPIVPTMAIDILTNIAITLGIE